MERMILPMKFLKNLNKLVRNSLLLTLIISSSNSAANAASLAAINMAKIYQSYSLVQEANQALAVNEENLKNLLLKAESELAATMKDKTKEAEANKKRDSFQLQIDKEVEAAQATKILYNETINNNIDTALKAFAKEKQLDLIMDKSFVMVAIPDLTDDFLTQLEKNSKSLKKTSSTAKP